MKLLLDTSILIDVLRLRNRRREWIAELVRGGHDLSTTTLNVAEIYAGMQPAEEGRTEALLSGLELYELNGSSARVAESQTVASYPARRNARRSEASVLASSSTINRWALAVTI